VLDTEEEEALGEEDLSIVHHRSARPDPARPDLTRPDLERSD
jgi:hypothetical protein